VSSTIYIYSLCTNKNVNINLNKYIKVNKVESVHQNIIIITIRVQERQGEISNKSVNDVLLVQEQNDSSLFDWVGTVKGPVHTDTD